MPAYTYVIAERGTGMCKIGYAKNHPIKRVKTLQVAHPFELVVICILKGGQACEIESRLHRQFKDKWIRGEWYALDKTDIKSIMGMPEAMSSASLSEMGISLGNLPCETSTTALALKEREQRYNKALERLLSMQAADLHRAELAYKAKIEAVYAEQETQPRRWESRAHRLEGLLREQESRIEAMKRVCALEEESREELEKELGKQGSKLEIVRALHTQATKTRNKYRDALEMIWALLQTECVREYGENREEWDSKRKAVRALRLIERTLKKRQDWYAQRD